jgi:hypothetical protein
MTSKTVSPTVSVQHHSPQQKTPSLTTRRVHYSHHLRSSPCTTKVPEMQPPSIPGHSATTMLISTLGTIVPSPHHRHQHPPMTSRSHRCPNHRHQHPPMMSRSRRSPNHRHQHPPMMSRSSQNFLNHIHYISCEPPWATLNVHGLDAHGTTSTSTKAPYLPHKDRKLPPTHPQ